MEIFIAMVISLVFGFAVGSLSELRITKKLLNDIEELNNKTIMDDYK